MQSGFQAGQDDNQHHDGLPRVARPEGLHQSGPFGQDFGGEVQQGKSKDRGDHQQDATGLCGDGIETGHRAGVSEKFPQPLPRECYAVA